MLCAWQPNTLPLPAGALIGQQTETGAKNEPVLQSQTLPVAPLLPIPDIADNFSKGRVVKYFPHQGYGLILDGHGRELYFNLKEIDFVGEKGMMDLLLNVPVGFDVSQTSHGLHVKKLKIY